MSKLLWENRDNLGYAWRILSDGCCDGCSLGTTGMHDWTMKGIHLCQCRLQLLRLNTMPAMNLRLLEDADALRKTKTRSIFAPGPAVRSDDSPARGRKASATSPGMRRWMTARGLRETDPHRLGWFVTSRGLTNESYYAQQKVGALFRHQSRGYQRAHLPRAQHGRA